MEQMPYQPGADKGLTPVAPARHSWSSWRSGLPTLCGGKITLRELRTTDAASLFAAMSEEEVQRFISPPPATVEGFERFIVWAQQGRATGHYACFAIVPRGSETAIGLFQVRSLDPDFGVAEWGFAMASDLWGTGIFVDAARLIADFAFDVLGVHRLEARVAVRNGRGNGAIRKLGAVQEGVLRRSFLRRGEYLDQLLWVIAAEDWREAKTIWASHIIH